MGDIYRVDYSTVGGSIANIPVVGIAHKVADANKIYTCLINPTVSTDGIVSFVWDSTNEVEHTATGYGGVFDFTVSVTSSISLRFYSASYTTKYFDMDVIKNGVTVESGIQYDQTVSNMSQVWYEYIPVSA